MKLTTIPDAEWQQVEDAAKVLGRDRRRVRDQEEGGGHLQEVQRGHAEGRAAIPLRLIRRATLAPGGRGASRCAPVCRHGRNLKKETRDAEFCRAEKAGRPATIDTVLVCMVDMQGRLMGKRFHVSNFIESGHEETHCCNYLLATDIEMATPDGYASTSGKRAMATTS
jgi:hypothetical protein